MKVLEFTKESGRVPEYTYSYTGKVRNCRGTTNQAGSCIYEDSSIYQITVSEEDRKEHKYAMLKAMIQPIVSKCEDFESATIDDVRVICMDADCVYVSVKALNTPNGSYIVELTPFTDDVALFF